MAIILAMFLVIRVLEFTNLLHPLAASYADDLICLPLVLGTVLWAHRLLLGRGSAYFLPRTHGLFTFLIFAIYFEAVLPLWQSKAVADPWDVLMYLLGYLIFEIWIQRKKAAPKGDLFPAIS